MDLQALAKNKTLWIVGGVGVVLWVWKPWASAAPATGILGSDIATGSALAGDTGSSASVAAQVSAAQNQTLATVGQMLQGYQNQQTDSLTAMSQEFGQAMSGISSQTQTMLQTYQQQLAETQKQNQDTLNTISAGFAQSIAGLTSKVQQLQAQPVQQAPAPWYQPIASMFTPPAVPPKPTVTVALGSAESRYITQEFGTAVNIQYSNQNQFVGAERPQTNQMYVNYLASLGVAPQHQLSTAELWNA